MSSDGKVPLDELDYESEDGGIMGDSLDETIKENASVVDSSLTECKNDTENSDATDCSSEKDKEEHNGNRQDIQTFDDANNSPMKNENKTTTRYFVIKSLNHNNIQLSIEKGIWATQVMNEPILEEAFHNSDRVILIFSVNMSGFFQGYAQMMSPVGWRRDSAWSKSGGGNSQWGRTFKVKWLQLNDLPFQKTLHLKNPLNDHKPVKISRDCQELPADVGEALCGLFDGELNIKGALNRNSQVNFGDEDSLVSAPSSHISWPGSTMLHPPFLYQHNGTHEDHFYPVTQERLSSSPFVQGSPFYMDSSEIVRTRESKIQGSSSNRQGDKANFLQANKRDISGEGSLTVSVSEDDILNMTYEEYLQAVGRNYLASAQLVDAGQSWTTQASQSTRAHGVDPYSRYLANWHQPKKAKIHPRPFH